MRPLILATREISLSPSVVAGIRHSGQLGLDECAASLVLLLLAQRCVTIKIEMMVTDERTVCEVF